MAEAYRKRAWLQDRGEGMKEKTRVFDISGTLKRKNQSEIKMKELSYCELMPLKGKSVYVLYMNGVVDKATVYEITETDVTFWGSYDENGDAVIAMFTESQYGKYVRAFTEVNE